MRLRPPTLLGRNILLLLTLFALALVCGAVTLHVWIQKPRLTQLATLVASQFRLAQANLEDIPAAGRSSMRPWLNSRSGGVSVLPATTSTPPAELTQPRWFVRQFIDDLQTRLPRQASMVRWVPENHGTVWARMPVAGEQFWFTETGVNLAADVPTAVIALFAFFSLLAIAGAVLIQRRINRPLAVLVEATSDLAEHQRREPLDERGPSELAAVSRAFNRMAETLANAEAERAIVLAGVSHDLRTPIAKMRLAIEMLARHGESELIESMRRSAAEMTSVTEQFMLYARPQTAALELELADLGELVLDTVESYKASGRSIHVDLEAGSSVRLHPQLFRRALDNLLTNALRYSDGDVEVRTQFRDGHACVSVLDRGPGIPASEVAAMRKPFARGARGPHVPGAGLGLAIVDRIVHAHGAQLELLARDGGGLVARIDLPGASALPGSPSRALRSAASATAEAVETQSAAVPSSGESSPR